MSGLIYSGIKKTNQGLQVNFFSFCIKHFATVAAVALLTVSTSAQANYAERDDVRRFIDELVNDHGFDRAYLNKLFTDAERLDNVLESIARPAEKTLNWKQYRPIFVTEKRTRRGHDFIKEHRATLERAEKEYGVPLEIIAAVIGVETYYGRITGSYTVFDSLTTLGFDYPPRSRFFKSELKQFLLLSNEEHIDVEDMTGSYAGAMGMPQFISSSYRRYAVDFDGDGKRDLWNSVPDVIGSVANYFSEHGWKRGQGVVYPVKVTDTSVVPEKNSLKPYDTVASFMKKGVVLSDMDGSEKIAADDEATLLKLYGNQGDEYWLGLKNFYVITRYNHSDMYALAVYQLSQKLKEN